jgi:hypothetical protein
MKGGGSLHFLAGGDVDHRGHRLEGALLTPASGTRPALEGLPPPDSVI